MSAAIYNIPIDQGSDWSIQIVATEDDIPVDLTGYFARAQMRPRKLSDTISGTFDCNIPNPAGGVITMALGHAISTAMKPAVYYYDLEIYTSGDAQVTRLLKGTAKIDTETTK